MSNLVRVLTGNSAVKAISLLISKGVPESHIIFLNLIAVNNANQTKPLVNILSLSVKSQMFCLTQEEKKPQAPQGIHALCKKYPMVKIVTSEIDASLNEDSRVIPGMGEFADRYFGTDNYINSKISTWSANLNLKVTS